MFGKKTASVTTRAELDAALGRSDEVIVEGDDALLSYALARIAKDPSVELTSATTARVFAPAAPSDGDATLLAPSALLPARGRSPTSRYLALAVALVAICAVVAGSYSFFAASPSPPPAPVAAAPPPAPLPRSISPAITTPQGQATVGNPGNAAIPPSAPIPLAPDGAGAPKVVAISEAIGAVAPLMWPAVAIFAIVALFLITRQAVGAGQNVEISWKVTEKVSGRLVITKVQKRAANAGKTA
jgi:hypothetical protein